MIAAALVMLFAGNAQAQLGVNFGYAPQTTSNTINNKVSTSEMPGFFAGVNYNMALTHGLGLSIGVDGRYNTKTTKETVLSATATTKETQLLIDVPVLFNFGLTLGEATTLSVFFGPTFTYALKGNTNYSENVLNTSTDYNWYGENADLKQFDILATAGASLRYHDFRLFGGYRMGLLDISKSDKCKSNTSGLFVGLGYVL